MPLFHKPLSNGQAVGFGSYLMKSAGWYAPPAATYSTSQEGSNGVLRLSPLWIPHNVTLDRIGVNITVGGAAGAGGAPVYRLGIWLPDTNGIPLNLLLDAGTVDASAAAVVAATISQAVGPGLIWLGVANQGVPDTRPTASTAQTISPMTTDATQLVNNRGGYSDTGITGAFDATLSSIGVTGAPTAVHVRVA